MNKGDVYHGEILVLEFNGCLDVKVRFLSTGYEVVTQSQKVRDNTIRDRMIPSVYGVGFLGGVEYRAKVNKIETESYIAWKGMLQRCFDEKWRKANPYYYGVTVCDDWLNFQVFSRWFYKNKPEPGKRYQLDKDSKVHGNKVYCPSACSLLSQRDNVRESSSRTNYSTRRKTTKKYIITPPHGDGFEIENLAKFCKENNLSDAHMSSTSTGKRKHHKRWKARLL